MVELALVALACLLLALALWRLERAPELEEEEVEDA